MYNDEGSMAWLEGQCVSEARKTETYFNEERKAVLEQQLAEIAELILSVKTREKGEDLESYRTAVRLVWPSTSEPDHVAMFVEVGTSNAIKTLPPGCRDPTLAALDLNVINRLGGLGHEIVNQERYDVSHQR